MSTAVTTTCRRVDRKHIDNLSTMQHNNKQISTQSGRQLSMKLRISSQTISSRETSSRAQKQIESTNEMLLADHALPVNPRAHRRHLSSESSNPRDSSHRNSVQTHTTTSSQSIRLPESRRALPAQLLLTKLLAQTTILIWALLGGRDLVVAAKSVGPFAHQATPLWSSSKLSQPSESSSTSTSGQISPSSIRVNQFVVPANVTQGDYFKINCLPEVRGETLHALKLFKDGHEFYRYSPNPDKRERELTFPADGLKVDPVRSARGQLTLGPAKPQSAGTYKCQVSVKGTHRSVSEERQLAVLPRPIGSPTGATSGSSASSRLGIVQPSPAWLPSQGSRKSAGQQHNQRQQYHLPLTPQRAAEVGSAASSSQLLARWSLGAPTSLLIVGWLVGRHLAPV